MDPFCGRGTTNLASRMLGIPSVGVDISPVAVAIAAAKSVGPSPEEVVREAEKILAAPGEPHDIPEGEFWELAYDPGVLRSLCKFREALLADCVSPARIALRGIILGALHGPLTKTTPSYFSNQAPRTFAPKPNYSVSFWRRRGLVPPRVDVLEVIRIRAERYYRLRLPNVETVLIRADSTDQGIVQVLSEFRSRIGGPCSAIVTSPPYFGMSTYIPDQWLRNWFLGGPARVDYDSKGQIGRGSLEEYVRKLSQAWRNVGCACDRGSRMVVRFGSICSALVDAVAVFEESLAGTGWVIIKITDAGSSSRGKRQADAFSCAGALAANEIDFYCMRE
ncbi:MAG TPA: site-specific DNA-methyltransferase [Firmicutes bacterium]|nr:site-specific DNA-methyltransferase [Candidatus Fermentithermobacillaceae bacterium]